MNPGAFAPDRDGLVTGNPATTADSAAAGESFPWPPPTGGTLDAVVETWRRSVFAPAAFFRALPVTGRLGAAVTYYLLIGMIVAAIGLFWQFTLGPVLAEHPLIAGLGGRPATPLLTFLFTPIYLLASLVLAAIVAHGALWIVGGARHGLAHSASVVAYAYGPQLFVIVPVAGPLVGTVWMIAVLVIGLREAHATTTARAATAVLLPLALLLIVIVLIVIALIAAGRSLLPELAA